MAFSAGVFTRLYNWVTEQASSPIEIAKLDTQEEDFATAFNNCILRDGTGVPTANTPWNSKRITGLADPSSAQDAATKAYVDTGTSASVSATGVTGIATRTVYYAKAGNVVVLHFPIATATSNATTFTYTGLPASLTPARAQTLQALDVALTDNGTDTTGTVTISGTTVTFSKTSGSWTASGTKGVQNAFTVTYLLN